jgi:hypothetical protein
MTEYKPGLNETLAMLFNPGTIDRATRAYGIVVEPYTHVSYPNVWPYCTLTLNYDSSAVIPIRPDAFEPQPFTIKSLLDFMREVEAIYLQYEQVKAMLRWFDRNATAGAVRYYWPAVTKLCPSSPALAGMSDGPPSRFRVPAGISERLQMVRDTATILAGAALLPRDVKPRPLGYMRLTLQTRKVTLRNEVTLSTDQIIVNV